MQKQMFEAYWIDNKFQRFKIRFLQDRLLSPCSEWSETVISSLRLKHVNDIARAKQLIHAFVIWNLWTNNEENLISIIVRKKEESKNRSILHDVDISFSSHLEAGREKFDFMSSP